MTQPVKTKKKSGSSKEGWLSELVASAKGSPVPVRKKESIDPARAKTLTSVRTDSIASTATRVSVRLSDVTSPSRIQASQKQRVSSALSPDSAEEASGGNRKIAIVLLLAMVALVGYVLLGSSGGGHGPAAPQYDRAKIQERVDYHRQQTGYKLNSDRIKAEYENTITAPDLSVSSKKIPAPNMMEGLPLATEPIHRKSSRDRIMPTNPDYPDARVMYGLQEEQAANEWEDEAQRKYVEEFVRNAAAAGYRVRIDKNYDVTVQPGRRPQSALEERSDISGGLAR